MQESLSRLQVKEFQTYRLKKDSFAGVFLWVLPNISERFFVLFAKHLCVTISAKYPLFCSLRRPLPAQTLPSTFVILNRFEKNTVNCFRTALRGGSSLLFSGEYVHVNIFFSFLLSVSEMTKAATRDALWNKLLPKVSQISQENTCVAVFFK